MKKWAKITLVSVAVAVFAAFLFGIILCWYAPRYGADKRVYDVESKGDDGEDVTMLSFNIRCFSPEDLFRKSWFYRASLVVDTIADVAPDIIGFQEVSPLHEAYLRRHLAGYTILVRYRTAKGSQEGVALAYRTARFAEATSGAFWISETPEQESKDWGSAFPRVAVYATLLDNRTGKTFTVLNTHLDHISGEAREQGMRVLCEQKAALGFGETVMMGDMNDDVESLQYRYAMEHGFADAALVADTSEQGHGATYQGFGAKLDTPRIDYFYCTEGWHVTDYRVVERTFDGAYASDHFAIAATMSL